MAIEFGRNITFGQYLDLGSPIHRMDPRAKILATGALLVAVLSSTSFAGLALLLAALAAIQMRSRIPIGYTLRGMRLLIATLLVLVVFQVLFYPLPPDADALWRWGPLSVSLPGMRLGLLVLVRVLMLYFLTSTLMFTTTMMDLADGVEVLLGPLKRLRVPVNELVMVLVVAIKFVPILVGELERMIKAQAARGAALDQGNLVQRARLLGGLLIPLFVQSFSRAEILTTAMEARCYRGGQGRTRRRVLTLRRSDVLAVLLATLAGAGALLLGWLVRL